MLDAVTRGVFTSASRFCPRTINNKTGAKSSRFNDREVFLSSAGYETPLLRAPRAYTYLSISNASSIRAFDIPVRRTYVILYVCECVYVYTYLYTHVYRVSIECLQSLAEFSFVGQSVVNIRSKNVERAVLKNTRYEGRKYFNNFQFLYLKKEENPSSNV